MRKVLIADDDAVCRDSIGEHLITEGYETLKAASGHEAIKIFKNQPLDVVLIDLKMPDMDGIDTMIELKKQSPHVPMIMLTGYGDIQTAIKAVKCGAFDFLTKPVPFDLLLSTIGDALRGKPSKDLYQALTLRQTEALTWTARGKSLCETAEILGIDERTVRFHIDNATRKLNACNKMNAIAKAIELGLIKVTDVQ